MKPPSEESMKSYAEEAGRGYADALFAELGPNAAATPEEAAAILARAMQTLSVGMAISLRRWGYQGNREVFKAGMLIAVASFAERCRELGWKLRAMSNEVGHA